MHEDDFYNDGVLQLFSRKQKIELGPLSGKANVIYWLNMNHIAYDASLVDAVCEIMT